MTVRLRLTRSSAMLLVFLTVLFAHSMVAQQHPNLERGFAAEKVYSFGELDSVNMLNLNLNLSIPLGQSYPVSSGFSYSMALAYNTKLWDYEPFFDPNTLNSSKIGAVASRTSNAGFGWQLSMGGLSGPGSQDVGSPWTYDAPHGGEQRFYTTLHPGQVGTPNVLYTRDSSYLRLRITQPNVSAEVDFPDGVTREFEYLGNSKWRLLRIRDQFVDETGNYTNFVNFSYEASSANCAGESSVWVMTDAHGRRTDVCFADFSYNDTSTPMVTEIVQPAFDDPNTPGADVSRHTFTYVTRAVDRGCHSEAQGLSPTLNLPLLEQVLLPDGSVYEMSYTLLGFGPGSGCPQGSIVQLTLPTRGMIQWEYGGIQMPVYRECPTSLDYAEFSNAVSKKKHLDSAGALLGEWTYLSALSPQPAMESFVCENQNWRISDPPREEMANSVTLPTKDKTIHYFSVWPGPGGPGNGSADSVNGFKVAEYTLPFTRFAGTGLNGKFLSQEIFDCDAVTGACPPAPVRRTYVSFERDEGLFEGGTGPTDENWRRKATSTLFLDDGNRHQTAESSDFDGFGNYRRTFQTSDFAASDERESIIDFNAGSNAFGHQSGGSPGSLFISTGSSWITGLYSRQSNITKVNGVDEAVASDSCFDRTTGALLGNRIYKANATISTEPNVSPARRLVTPAASANDLVTIFTRDFISDGISISRGDVQIQDWFGGDLSPLTSNDICIPRGGSEYRVTHHYVAGTLATSQWRGVNWLSVDNTIDPSTGRVKVARDPAGIASTLNYDTSARLVSVRPATGHGAWSRYAFANATTTAPATVTIFESTNGSISGNLRQSSIEFDSFGRVAKEKQFVPTLVNPGGEAVSRLTRYNALGWKTAISQQESGEPVRFTTYSGFDPFGRPGRISPPSTTAFVNHDIALSYQGVREVRRTRQIATGAENGALAPSTTIEQYDANGRLVRVIEPLTCRSAISPCPDADRGPVSEYSYNVLGNLARVCGNAVNGNCTQLRLFNYDGRGFLTSEQTPERGVNGNAITGHSLYDSRGNAGRRLTSASGGLFDLRISYDGIGRPLTLASNGGSRVMKEWLYDQHPNGYARNAAMVRSTRRNSDPLFGSDFVVQEHIQYEGGAGRISRIDTDITHPQAGARSLFQTSTWTDLGEPDERLYPFFTGMPVLEIKNDYTSGILTRVRNKSGGDYASSIRYHQSGMTHQVTHANGMTETIASDASGIARPQSIAISGGAWNSGDYSYDGAGNIAAIGNTRYSYDPISRLTGWNESRPNGFSSHYLGYDLFGNKYDLGFKSCGGDPASGIMHCAQTSVAVPEIDASSNHFAQMSYDANGNVVTHGTYSYTYDGTDMMTAMSTGSRNFRYLYTADDERIGTYDTATQTWSWKLRDIGGKPLREFTSSGGTLGFANWTWSKDFIYRGSSILASITPTETQHFHLDHLGTPRLITTAGGGQRGRHDYEPFGAETTSSLQNDQRLKFTSHERDLNGPATSEDRDYLDYMHARFYNPNVGRFLSVDPQRLDRVTTTPQAWNRYAYALNNPLKYVDPDGRETQLVLGHHTRINPVGHIAIAINGRVYSFGTEYTRRGDSKDWGGSLAVYLDKQKLKRETSLLTLNITSAQERRLELLLQKSNPNEPGAPLYNEITNSCVTVCQTSLQQTGILARNKDNGMGGLTPVGALTPDGLSQEVLHAGLVNRVRVTGTAEVAWWESVWNFIKGHK